jgi:autotransporter-associated beta strand protein
VTRAFDVDDGGAKVDLIVQPGVVNSASTDTNNGLLKTGAGTLALAGSNTYSGATTVNAGRLLIDGALTPAVNGVTVNSGGTLGGTGNDVALTRLAGGSVLLVRRREAESQAATF